MNQLIFSLSLMIPLSTVKVFALMPDMKEHPNIIEETTEGKKFIPSVVEIIYG